MPEPFKLKVKIVLAGTHRKGLRLSPGILSRKVGQPATNCKRRFFNGFWSRNMSSITYQKSPKIRVGEVDEKRVFFRALYRLILRCMKTRLYVLPVVLLEFETPYSMD